MNCTAASYRGHRFPPEIISHAVWLYYRFCLRGRAGVHRNGGRGLRGAIVLPGPNRLVRVFWAMSTHVEGGVIRCGHL